MDCRKPVLRAKPENAIGPCEWLSTQFPALERAPPKEDRAPPEATAERTPSACGSQRQGTLPGGRLKAGELWNEVFREKRDGGRYRI